MTQSATSFLTEEDKVISVEAASPHDLRKLAREISSAAGTSGALSSRQQGCEQRWPLFAELTDLLPRWGGPEHLVKHEAFPPERNATAH